MTVYRESMFFKKNRKANSLDSGLNPAGMTEKEGLLLMVVIQL